MTHNTPTQWCWDPLPADARGWYVFRREIMWKGAAPTVVIHASALFNNLHGALESCGISPDGSGHLGPYDTMEEAQRWAQSIPPEPTNEAPATQPRPRLDLLPTAPLEEVARVLAHGAEKYDPYNWCNGTRWGRCYRALLSHAWAWWRGEDTDPDSGLSHLAHCICNLLFLMEYQRNGWGEDDRFRGPTGAAFKKNDGLR